MALGLVVATDIVNAALIFYVRGKTLSNTTQEKPLMKALMANQKTFPSGNLQISLPVQGVYMSDTQGFMAGYSEDDQLAFAQAMNILRAVYPWKEVAAGLIITWTELKKDGITVTDHQKTSEHSQVELTRLTGLLENRLDDFGESWARAINLMLWQDGSQDAKAVPGLRSILTDVAGTGTTGGLSRSTYQWWQHRVNLNLAPSAENQTLTRFLRQEKRQLRRYGGKPDTILCGSGFIDALELELQNKGVYTQQGWDKSASTEVNMNDISLRGLGTFMYDPTLDDFGFSKRAYIWDSRRIQLRPMEGEEDKILTPERPYNYLVFLRTITWTGGLAANQLNCNAVYGLA